ARATEARNAIAALHQQAAEAAYADYQKSVAAHSPKLGVRRMALQQATLANRVVQGYPPARKLQESLKNDLDSLLEPDHAALQAFQKALTDQTPGFAGLAAARQHSAQVLEVVPEYSAAVSLHNDIVKEEGKMEAAVLNAEALEGAKRYDEAVDALGPYRTFASEAPRIEAIVTGAYSFHLNRGQELVKQQDWEHATAEFRAAQKIRGDSTEAATALKNLEQ